MDAARVCRGALPFVTLWSLPFASIEDTVVEAVRGGADPVQAHQRVRYDMMTKAGYKP